MLRRLVIVQSEFSTQPEGTNDPVRRKGNCHAQIDQTRSNDRGRVAIYSTKMGSEASPVPPGGTLTFQDATIDFWANSILVENGGTLRAGAADDARDCRVVDVAVVRSGLTGRMS